MQSSEVRSVDMLRTLKFTVRINAAIVHHDVQHGQDKISLTK